MDEPSVRTRDPVDEATRRWAERYPDASGFRGLTSLIRTYGVVVRSVESVLRPLGLNLSRFEVLLLLSFTRAGRLPTMRLRDLLMVHGSSVTYLVDKLEEAGLVERRQDPDDGRVWLICITPAGAELVDRAATRLVEFEFGALGSLEAGQRGALAELLARMRADGDVPAGA